MCIVTNNRNINEKFSVIIFEKSLGKICVKFSNAKKQPFFDEIQTVPNFKRSFIIATFKKVFTTRANIYRLLVAGDRLEKDV